ncbi:MAG: stage IV sporulation protein A, partial [Clostridia bacterium]|nr:stage IV sporulation protein A [Clostridia bacterium]
TDALDEGHPVRCELMAAIRRAADGIHKIGEIADCFAVLGECEYVSGISVGHLDMGTGSAVIDVALDEALYYAVLSEMTGLSVSGEGELIETIRRLAAIKNKYDKIAEALEAVEEKGYGIVMPNVSDLKLDEPQIVKQAGGYGVRLRASAQSVHMIRANIEAEINPIVGTEQQSEDLVRNLLREFEEDPQRIWGSNMFGKSLYELVNEGLHAKLEHMPDDARAKLAETLERIINEGSGGLICILL